MDFIKRVFAGLNKTAKPIQSNTYSPEIKHYLVSDLVEEIELDRISIDEYKNCSFLVVDDNKEQRQLMSCFLKKYHACVDCAENGEAALRRYLEQPDKYDVIFMDLQMPVMSGNEAAKKIRESKTERGKTIPIIAFSGNSDPIVSQNEMLFCYYLLKPCTFAKIAYFINKILVESKF